jgi:hypothetical protein
MLPVQAGSVRRQRSVTYDRSGAWPMELHASPHEFDNCYNGMPMCRCPGTPLWACCKSGKCEIDEHGHCGCAK